MPGKLMTLLKSDEFLNVFHLKSITLYVKYH